jgi:hypothetical protein
MPIHGVGLMNEEDDEQQGDGQRLVYVLHPNCAIEEM